MIFSQLTKAVRHTCGASHLQLQIKPYLVCLYSVTPPRPPQNTHTHNNPPGVFNTRLYLVTNLIWLQGYYALIFTLMFFTASDPVVSLWCFLSYSGEGRLLSGERAAEGLSRAVGYTLNVNGRVRMGKQAHWNAQVECFLRVIKWLYRDPPFLGPTGLLCLGWHS